MYYKQTGNRLCRFSWIFREFRCVDFPGLACSSIYFQHEHCLLIWVLYDLSPGNWNTILTHFKSPLIQFHLCRAALHSDSSPD